MMICLCVCHVIVLCDLFCQYSNYVTFRLPGAIFYLKLFEEVSLILILVRLVWHRLPSGLTLNLMMSNGAQMKPLGMNLGHPQPQKTCKLLPHQPQLYKIHIC